MLLPMVQNLGETNSIINQYIAEIRDIKIQKDPMRFRRNLQRIGNIFGYEISKLLNFEKIQVQTQLGEAEVSVLKDKLVLGTILRAGIPLHQGMLEVFDTAENAFVGAYRKYNKLNKFHIEFDYLTSPEITDKVLIIADPMLATGASMVLTCNKLYERGTPEHTHIVSVIAYKDGIEHILKNCDMNRTTIWVGAIDTELTAKGYIVPGLGDVGDLCYGVK